MRPIGSLVIVKTLKTKIMVKELTFFEVHDLSEMDQLEISGGILIALIVAILYIIAIGYLPGC